MKRILVMTGNFYPDVGGAITDIFEICTRFIRRGYEIDIVACNTKGISACEQLEGINIYRLDSWNLLQGEYPVPKPSLRNFHTLQNLLRKKHDLVHVYTRFYVNSTLGLVLSKLKRVPLVHTELGTGHNMSSSPIVRILSRMYDHTLGTLLVRLADKVTVESRSTISFLKHIGLRKEATLIPCGVSTPLFQHKNSSLREQDYRACQGQTSPAYQFDGFVRGFGEPYTAAGITLVPNGIGCMLVQRKGGPRRTFSGRF